MIKAYDQKLDEVFFETSSSMYKRQKSKMEFMRPSFQRRARRTGISFRYYWMGSFFISDEMTSQNKRDSKL